MKIPLKPDQPTRKRRTAAAVWSPLDMAPWREAVSRWSPQTKTPSHRAGPLVHLRFQPKTVGVIASPRIRWTSPASSASSRTTVEGILSSGEMVTTQEGRKAAPQLRRLLPPKNRAEYDPEPISATEAKAADTAAARMVRIAEQTVKQVGC